ncbi:SHOCT domain-containing protein [Nitratidesulfovibrio sp. D1]
MRTSSRRSGSASDSSDSLKILKERLARGDITLEEYNTLKNVL